MSNLYAKISQRPMKRNEEQIFSVFPYHNIEMFNVLAPFHQNSASAAAAAAGPAVQNGGGGNRGVGAGGVENMQVTQPCSAPSSPTITSPGAISSTSFCLPLTTTSSSSATGTGAGGSSTSSSVITSTTTGGGTTDTGDPNWQATKSTIRERNAAMFNNDLMADIRFIVGTDEQVQTIPAHKYVLATGSSVFYAMFYGGLAEAKEEIVVPDVEPTAFLTLLKYLYCDEIHLEADNVLATLYVAKKYIVPHLARACVNYLETSLTAKNACLLLSQSRLFEEPELMQRCWEVIDAQVCCEHRPNLEVVIPSTARHHHHHQRHHSYSCCQQQVLLAREKEQEEVVVVANKSSAVEGTASSSASSSATVSSSVSTSSLSTETDNPSV
uniref:BTB/POZ domain-containing protein 6 n=1 Tax=Culex pipiens TaxID=7175 RepID=A0A8D8F9Z5_CULPI